MRIELIEKQIKKSKLLEIAKDGFGDLIKAVVDVKKGIMTIGGELHADAQAILLEKGSNLEDLWGINIYPEKSKKECIEFTSMLNVKPSQGNRTKEIQCPKMKQKITNIVNQLIQDV